MALLYIALSFLVLAAVAIASVAWVSAYKFRTSMSQSRVVTSDPTSLLWTGVRRPADALFFSSGASLALFLIVTVLGVASLERGVQPVALTLLGLVAVIALAGSVSISAYYRLFARLKATVTAEQKAFLAVNGLEQEGEADLSGRIPVHAETAIGDAPDSPAFVVKRLSDGVKMTAFFRLQGGQVSFLTV